MSSYTIPNVIERTAFGSERTADIFSRLLSDRIIYIGTPIDDGVANTVVAEVLHLENESPDMPIQIYINSAGGDAQAVMAIYDALTYVQPDVITFALGEVVAAPVILLAAGTAGMRNVLPHARIVLHPLEASGRGAVPDLILATEEVERIRRNLEQLLSEHTGKDLSRVRRDLERETVLDARAAVDYG